MDEQLNIVALLRRNKITTFDNKLMKLDSPSFDGEFFDVHSNQQSINKDVEANFYGERGILDVQFTMVGETIEHERQIYTFMDLIGNLGGVHDLILLLFSLFFGSISEHSYILKALEKLYLVKTKEKTIFNSPV